MKSWDFLTKSVRIEGFEDPCIFGHGNEQNPLDNSSLYYVTRDNTRCALPACHFKGAGGAFSSGAVWESRWPSWTVRPNEPSGFRGRKAILNYASALVSHSLSLICQPTSEDIKQHYLPFCSLAKGWILVLSRITLKRILWNSAWWCTNTMMMYKHHNALLVNLADGTF